MKTLKYEKLDWMRQNLDKKMNWEEAIDYCESLGNGWRLPTSKELMLITDHSKANPAIKIDAQVKSDWYWSSTTYVTNTGFAWVVGLKDGGVSIVYKTSNYYVWPVRDIAKLEQC